MADQNPDIKRLIGFYRKIRTLQQLLSWILITFKDIILWRHKVSSLIVLLIITALCYLPELLVMGCLQAAAVVMVMGPWYAKEIQSKAAELEDQMDDLAEMRLLLFQLENFLKNVCDLLNFLRDVVTWKRKDYSVRYSIFLVLEIIILAVFGLRLFSAAFPLLLFCFSPGFSTSIVFLSKSLSFHKAPNKEEEEEEVNKDNLVRHDLQCGDFDKEAKEKSCDDGYDELSQDDEHLEALSAQEARQTKVMKWKKSKQRLKSSPRQCSLCQASFSNLLKRKHRCNYCGLHYCGSCTVKVKKCLLGATSPAAYEDEVRVCIMCHDQLKVANKEFEMYQQSDSNVDDIRRRMATSNNLTDFRLDPMSS